MFNKMIRVKKSCKKNKIVPSFSTVSTSLPRPTVSFRLNDNGLTPVEVEEASQPIEAKTEVSQTQQVELKF